MMKTTILAAIAVLAALSASAPSYAADPVYVLRPPVMQLKATVLPQTAFGASAANPGNPSQPSTPTPPSNGFVFVSSEFSDNAGEWSVTPSTGTINLGETWRLPRPAVSWCSIGDASSAGAFFQELDYQGGILPKVKGKYGLTIACDSVNNLPPSNPGSRYYGKVVLTVK